MRTWKPTDAMMRETEAACAAIPEPDRVTRGGKRIWDKRKPEETGAGIYFAGAMGANLVKIGWVRELSQIEKRLDRMRIDCPYPVMALFTFGPATRIHEGRLHKHFLGLHFHGEWFRYDGELREVLDMARASEGDAAERLREIVTVTLR